MDQVIAGLALLALVPLVWLLMLRGWRRRGAQQGAALSAPAGVDDPAWRGETSPEAAASTVTGTYVSTVFAGRPLERVTAHGLGSRSLVEVAAEGAAGQTGQPARLVLRRPGAASFSIPAADLQGAHRARGQAGKVMFGKEDLVVISWRLDGPDGPVALETAVRTKPQQDAPVLVALVEGLAPRPSDGPGAGPAGTDAEEAA